MRLFASELLKIRTAPRTVLSLLLAELVIVGIGTASVIDGSDESGIPEGFDAVRPRLERDLIDVTSASLLFAVLLGVLVITWEYRHGTISQTFLSTPVRDRVIAVKALVAGLAGAALVVPALLLMLVIAEIWVGNRLDFTGEDVERAGRVFLASAIVAVLGMEIGAITARQLGAVVVVFAWAIFAEPALAFWASVEDYLPLHAIFGGILGDPESGISFGRGLATIAVYVVALGAGGIALTRWRDIT
jgi:ABC-type transport system involved in multi-copper enzyme maturation permease subunit